MGNIKRENETMSEITVEDSRPSRDINEYEPFTTILDRILVRRLDSRNADLSGFAIPQRYREPESIGTVVCAGDGVVLGQQWYPMGKFLKVGDQVRYGEHSAEKYEVKDDPDFPDGEYFIVRLQDLRGVRRLIAKYCEHDWMGKDEISGISTCRKCSAKGKDVA